jgi:hypothetical protein
MTREERKMAAIMAQIARMEQQNQSASPEAKEEPVSSGKLPDKAPVVTFWQS